MRLESRKYLYDIARAAALAMEFIAGKSFADYTADAMLRSAVERQLEIVGEALARPRLQDPPAVSPLLSSRSPAQLMSTSRPPTQPAARL